MLSARRLAGPRTPIAQLLDLLGSDIFCKVLAGCEMFIVHTCACFQLFFAIGLSCHCNLRELIGTLEILHILATSNLVSVTQVRSKL